MKKGFSPGKVFFYAAFLVFSGSLRDHAGMLVTERIFLLI